MSVALTGVKGLKGGVGLNGNLLPEQKNKQPLCSKEMMLLTDHGQSIIAMLMTNK